MTYGGKTWFPRNAEVNKLKTSHKQWKKKIVNVKFSTTTKKQKTKNNLNTITR